LRQGKSSFFAKGSLMKILAIEREVPGISAETFQLHLKAEAARAWELYKTGVFREIYLDRDQHVAVVMLECADENEAREVLDSLPLVKAGLITFDIMPLVPYPGFARLFADAP
jgi:muconolactone delta-isomerase